QRFRKPSKNHPLIGFHADGKSLWVVEGGTALLLDVRTGTQIRTQSLERKPAKDDVGAISPDGRFAAFPVTESISQLFDLETGQAVRSFSGRGPGQPEYIFSPDGKFLAIAAGGGIGGEIVLPVFDTATGEVAITIRDPG